jgi:hypothetical protein
MITINLLPRKEFEIVLESGETVPGKFGTWATKRFMDKKKYSLKQYQELIASGDISMDDVCVIILSAIESKHLTEGKKFIYNDQHLCDWMDQSGGFYGDQWVALLTHSFTIDEEKKSQETDSSGTILNKSAIQQDLNQMSSGPVL